MPRPNPLRSMASEDNLARRIAYERERREWTYEGLAQRMTDAGCPIQGSAIYKTEKGRPQRRITVDELVALARVFAVDVADLLTPVDLVGDREARQIVDQWRVTQQEIVSRVQHAERLADRLEALAHGGTLREFPIHEFINSGLFGAIRKAQTDALAAFDVFVYDRDHDEGSARHREAAQLVARARAESHLDEDGHTRPSNDSS